MVFGVFSAAWNSVDRRHPEARSMLQSGSLGCTGMMFSLLYELWFLIIVQHAKCAKFLQLKCCRMDAKSRFGQNLTEAVIRWSRN